MARIAVRSLNLQNSNSTLHKSHPPSHLTGPGKEFLLTHAIHKPAPKMQTRQLDILKINNWPEFAKGVEMKCIGPVCSKVPVAFHRTCTKVFYADIQFPKTGVWATIVKCITKAMIQAAISDFLNNDDPEKVFEDALEDCLTNKGVIWASKVSVVFGLKSECSDWSDRW
jgi:hypothetical protein